MKPRSQAQQEQAHDYGHSTASVIALVPATAGMPTRSWWIGLNRADFDAVLRDERPRMAQSRFARAMGNSTQES